MIKCCIDRLRPPLKADTRAAPLSPIGAQLCPSWGAIWVTERAPTSAEFVIRSLIMVEKKNLEHAGDHAVAVSDENERKLGQD